MTNGDTPTEDEYIDAAAAGEILGVSTRQALRYAAGPEPVIRSRRIGRRVMLHLGDVHEIADQRAVPQMDAQPGRMVQASTLSVRVEEQQKELVQAAHTIGVLAERVRQLEGQFAGRPLLEDHVTLKAERDALRLQLETLKLLQDKIDRPRPSWWQRIFGA